MIFGKLQHRFVLNTSTLTQSGATWQNLENLKLKISLLTTGTASPLVMLLNKINSSSASKNGKIKAVHGLLEQLQSYLRLDMQRGAWWKVSQASDISERWRRLDAFCSRTANTSNIIFHYQ